MKKAFVILLKKSFTKQSTVSGCLATFQFNVKQDNSMSVIVERKQSNEVEYKVYKTFAGTGSFTNKNISFTDDLSVTSGGNVTYRIRLNIAADTTVYLDSLTVNAPLVCTNPVNSIKVNPNPVVDNVNIIISREKASRVIITLLNAGGKKMYETAYQHAAGSQVKTINMQQMATGIYFVKVLADDKKLQTIKILKK